MQGDFWGSASSNCITVPVDIATSGNNTIHNVTPGTRFIVYHLWLQAEAGVDVIVKSGGIALTGTITFAANAEKEWKNSGIGVFRARSSGNNLVLNLSGNIQVNGFALLSELTA